MVMLRQILGVLFILSMFIFITGIFVIADGLWFEHVVQPLKTDSGFTGAAQYFLFSLVMVFFSALIIAGVFMRFLQAVMGGLFYAQNVPGTGGAGLGFTALGPIMVGVTFIIMIMLFFVIDFIVSHVPLVVYLGAIVFVITGWLRNVATMFFR